MGIADEQYVSFTTYRKTGVAVSTAVWIAPVSGERAGFTTNPDAGKVKRLRNNSKVALRPCDRSGKVADGAVEVTGTAVVLTEGPDHQAVLDGITKKYGILGRVLRLGSTLRVHVLRGKPTSTILITFD